MAYIPNINGSMVRTLADWGQFFKTNGRPCDIIELLNQENTILDDILWREATDYDGHRTVVRDGLPCVYWRRLYRGTPPSKSAVSVVKDPVGMLETRSEIDAKLLELHQSQAKAYRMQEAKAFMESLRQSLAMAIFYGNIKDEPDSINGLAPRYAFKNAPQVVDAGGTKGPMTSIFGVVWGENDVTGIYPKDSPAGSRIKTWANMTPMTMRAIHFGWWATCIPGMWGCRCATGAAWCASATFRWKIWKKPKARPDISTCIS